MQSFTPFVVQSRFGDKLLGIRVGYSILHIAALEGLDSPHLTLLFRYNYDPLNCLHCCKIFFFFFFSSFSNPPPHGPLRLNPCRSAAPFLG